jgi:phage gpG-like protein
MSLSIRDTLSSGLRKLAGQVADKKPILEAVGLQLASITRRSFNEPALRAAPWAPLKAATLAAKIRAGKSSAILKRNLVLSRSWRVSSLTNSSVTVSTDRPYAPAQQFGSLKRGIPARPMLPFIGGPENAVLAPWARDKLTKIGQAKLASLLKQ